MAARAAFTQPYPKGGDNPGKGNDKGKVEGLTTSSAFPDCGSINPRQLALMHALVRFAHIAAGNTFTTAEIPPTSLQ